MLEKTSNPDASQHAGGERERQSGTTAAAIQYLNTGVSRCQFCPSRHLRLSRVRLVDWPKIFLFQFPVRCGRCGQRQYVPPLVAALCGRHQVMRGPLRKKQPEVSWASWTGKDSGETKAARSGPEDR